MKLLSILLNHLETVTRRLVMVIQLVGLPAISPGCLTTLRGHWAKPPEVGNPPKIGSMPEATGMKAGGKLLFKMSASVAALTLSAYVSAVGMGGLNVASTLGQPLKADIELVEVKKDDKSRLIVSLAAPDVYRGAGLEYPYGNKFKFQIESRANGKTYIKVSSEQPINDPFVSMLVELTWPAGKLLREYTFLIDPPDYVVEQPKPVEVQIVSPAVPSASPKTAAIPAVKAAAVPLPEQPAASEAADKGISSGLITVQRGDTLNKIATLNKPANVSLERMLIALYRANADEFDDKNMNRIKAGKILRVPAKSEIQEISQADAVNEIHAQVADWNAYRQKLAGAAPTSSKPLETMQVATGKIASSVADKAPVAKESAREVFKLSKGEAPGDKAGAGASGKPMTAQGRKNSEQEDAIARSKSLKEEQTRAALLEKNIKDMQHLAKLKSEAAALTQSLGQVSVVPGMASVSVAASQVAASQVAASQVAAASKVKPAPMAMPVEEPSLADQILGEPLFLIGGAAILIGLGVIGLILMRRKRAAAYGGESEEAGSAIGYIAEPVAPSPDTGDFTGKAETGAKAVLQLDEVDPISEADLFLNFGRDAQAEEILKDALQNAPNNHLIHLKLLFIYANRKDVNSFAVIARQLKDSGDEDAWRQAAAMGHKLDPANPIYGGVTVESAGSAAMQTTVLNRMPGVDLEVSDEVQGKPVHDVDFDLGDMGNIESTDDMTVAQAGTVDFDFSVLTPPIPEPDKQTKAIPEPDKQTKAPQDDLMEFTLDFKIDDIAEKRAPMTQSSGNGLADISLDFDGAATGGNQLQETRNEHWNEIATKLDLARAYQEMGDATSAREILEEALREGDTGQRELAQSMLDQLG